MPAPSAQKHDTAVKNNSIPCALVVSALMGLGHMRAAYALRDLAGGQIVLDGLAEHSTSSVRLCWQALRAFYYFLSRACEFRVVGPVFQMILYRLQHIPPLYPQRDQSRPTMAVRFLDHLIRKEILFTAILDAVRSTSVPVINSFYASAIAVDTVCRGTRNNYLLICDADINRIWVPRDPRTSSIMYLAPCTRAKRRLMAYGVPETRIHLTGFPLPIENIGSREHMEILKHDLLHRLARLDPAGSFSSMHTPLVRRYLGSLPEESDMPSTVPLTLTFAVGGAGAHCAMVGTILASVKDAVADGRLRLYLSAGIDADTRDSFLNYICSEGLQEHLDKGVHVIFHENMHEYLRRFNEVMRITDVLWTKPSELSFYCALGIPIITAPSVGTHEAINERWLNDVHAGIEPAGPVEYTHEWLFEVRDNGQLAAAAWDGFLKGRKLGAYKIHDIISTGVFIAGVTPLER